MLMESKWNRKLTKNETAITCMHAQHRSRLRRLDNLCLINYQSRKFYHTSLYKDTFSLALFFQLPKNEQRYLLLIKYIYVSPFLKLT